MFKKLYAFREAYLRDENGATAIEYGLIAAGISLAIASVVFTFGDDLTALFTTMEGTLEDADSEVTGR
ncbi:MAG: Flp family type IVb pilin [Alphaproteobacteria bacterium]|nr:Flp family type IVb pilin [Alphaproteobacteria bacterium]